MRVMGAEGLDGLFAALAGRGYTLVGPTVRDGAVVYDRIASPSELPRGWTDAQEAGTYRLEERPDGAWFGFAVGPHSFKRFLFPPAVRLFRVERDGSGGLSFTAEGRPEVRYAFIGVRPCELAAMAVQDRVFLDGDHVDPLYRARREGAFVVAVACGEPGGTCFCASMGTGPGVGETPGFDLALTEVLEGERHYFVVEEGSAAGREVLEELPSREAVAAEEEAARRVVERAAGRMGRRLETRDLPELLAASLDQPRWNEVAERCLTCANCTLVCPTCFCSTVEDTSELAGAGAERWRRWDSCFSVELSYLHGGSVRSSPMSRYRQWLTHKLGTWHDQFGTLGCVGCGRCITWCPVGIDITEEVAALRAAMVGAAAPPVKEGADVRDGER